MVYTAWRVFWFLRRLMPVQIKNTAEVKVMKKLISIILAALVLAAAASMTACKNGKDGGDGSSGTSGAASTAETTAMTDESGAEADTTAALTETESDSDAVTDDENEIAFPEALIGIEMHPVPELADSKWALSGGFVSGEEMNQEMLDAVLEAFGGQFHIVFDGKGNVRMTGGDDFADGTYEIINEEFAVYMTFEDVDYYGIFTNVDDEDVLMIVCTSDPQTVLYLTATDAQ